MEQINDVFKNYILSEKPMIKQYASYDNDYDAIVYYLCDYQGATEMFQYFIGLNPLQFSRSIEELQQEGLIGFRTVSRTLYEYVSEVFYRKEKILLKRLREATSIFDL